MHDRVIIQPTAATGGPESVCSRPDSPAVTIGTPDSLRGSQATLDLDRIEVTARAATPGRWHEFDGCVWTDVAECLHHGPSTVADREHVATMDPSTTLALVARVRELEAEMGERIFSHNEDVGLLREAMEHLRASEARLTEVDELETTIGNVDRLHWDRDGDCGDCGQGWPCGTHLAVHGEDRDGCRHTGGAE